MNNQSQIVNSRKVLIENIQKWALLDSQLKQITEKTKEYRELKSTLTQSICTYLQENNMQSTKIDTSNGHIKLYEKKDYSPLTFGYIEECLGKIIPDKSHVDFIIKYLKEHREIKSSTELRCIYKEESSA